MKHLISTLILIVCGIFYAQSAFSGIIETMGQWSEEDVRSFVPAPPTASIDGKVLTINFVSPLSDLTVTITDSTGRIVCKECISATTTQSLPIILNVGKGNYTLVFSHRYGYLTGTFAVQ